MNNLTSVCEQFANILNGKSTIDQDGCSVSLHRNIKVTVQGRLSRSVVPAGISFEALDSSGNALCFAEIAVLEEEIPRFTYAIVQQGMIVSALHNHWLYMDPAIFYIHVQSVEPPLLFARKMANAFTYLSSYPVA